MRVNQKLAQWNMLFHSRFGSVSYWFCFILVRWLYCEREANSETDVQLIILQRDGRDYILYTFSLEKEKITTECYFLPIPSFLALHYLQLLAWGGGTPYNGPCGEAPPERGIFFTLQVYERIGNIFFHSSV